VSAFLLRRLLAAVPLLLGAATLLFLLLEILPGRAFSVEPGAGASPAAQERLRRLAGTDRPLAERYAAWIGGLLEGDLGFSLSERQPVAAAVGAAAARTALLAGLAMALQFGLGAAAGLLAAGGAPWVDRGISAAAALLYAVPSFWLGLLLVDLFAVRLGWLPVSQMHSPGADALGGWDRAADAARHLLLPCLALALPASGGMALFVRDEARAALGGGLVRAARSRGLTRGRIVLRHGLPRALLAVSTLLGLALPGILGGSVVIEALYAWPGMGRLTWQATVARDAPLVLGCAQATAMLVVGGSLLADLLAASIDPRVRDRLGRAGS
jgi:peptide/nickel transport system permease protein